MKNRLNQNRMKTVALVCPKFFFINSEACEKRVLKNNDVVVGSTLKIPVGLKIDPSWKGENWDLQKLVDYLRDVKKMIASKCFRSEPPGKLHESFEFYELDSIREYRINGFRTIRELIAEFPYTVLRNCLYSSDYFREVGGSGVTGKGVTGKGVTGRGVLEHLPETIVRSNTAEMVLLGEHPIPIDHKNIYCESVVVGECSHIGAGSCIGYGVEIGKYCFIGLGVVISRFSKIPDGTVIPDGGRWGHMVTC